MNRSKVISILKRNSVVILFWIVAACNVAVEVPHKKCAVVVHGSEIEPGVLPQGHHRIAHGANLIFFDVTPQALELSFDFLLDDATQGDVGCTVLFTVKPDSLASFYKRYQVDRPDAALQVHAQSVVRKMLSDYNPEMIGQDDLQPRILRALQHDKEIQAYAEISDVHSVKYSVN